MSETRINICRAKTFGFRGRATGSQLIPVGDPVLTTAWTNATLLLTMIDSGSAWASDQRLWVVAMPAARALDSSGWLYPPIDEPLGSLRLSAPSPVQRAVYPLLLGDLRSFTEYMQLFLIWEQGATTSSASPTIAIDVIGRSQGLGLMPHMVAGRAFHFRADAGVSFDASGLVNQWWDQSGNGLHATQFTSARMPTLTDDFLNGKRGLRFDGGDILSTPAVSIGSFTIYTVVRCDSGSTAGLIYEHSADTNGNQGAYLYGSTVQTIYVNRSSVFSGKNLTTNWSTDGTPRIIRHHYAGAQSSHLMYVNGTLAATTDGVVGSPGTASVSTNFYIGARAGPIVGMTGYQAEIVAFSPALTPDQETRLERDYFSPRYGIQVP